MRHQVAGRKLGRTSSHRTALFRNMAISLIEHGRIRTTVQKAKELRSIADRLVTLAKSDSLHARRLAFDRLRNRDAVTRLFAVIAPAFKDINGGYTRVLKIAGHRPGDTADMAFIEYLREKLPAVVAPTTGESAKKSDKKVSKATTAKVAKAKAPKKAKAAAEDGTEKAKKVTSAKKAPAKKKSEE